MLDAMAKSAVFYGSGDKSTSSLVVLGSNRELALKP